MLFQTLNRYLQWVYTCFNSFRQVKHIIVDVFIFCTFSQKETLSYFLSSMLLSASSRKFSLVFRTGLLTFYTLCTSSMTLQVLMTLSYFPPTFGVKVVWLSSVLPSLSPGRPAGRPVRGHKGALKIAGSTSLQAPLVRHTLFKSCRSCSSPARTRSKPY